MNMRAMIFGLACLMGTAAGPALADDEGYGWMPHHYGHMPMMGYGHGWMMEHGPGWMMGPGHGWMMGPRGGWMRGPGAGWMHRGRAANVEQLSDEYLDRIGERIAERHQRMQQIAAEQDKAARRELVREHLKTMGRFGWSGRWDDDDETPAPGRGYRRGWMMGPGMMGPGMMGPGTTGPGTMGPGMMRGGQLGDEYLDRMGEHMVENYKRMQQLAGTTDKAKRRELLREHFESMNRYQGGMY